MLNVQLLGQLLKCGLLSLANHNLHHLLADELALRALGVACSADLSACSLGESNAEHTEEIAISSLGLHEGLNSGVPLLHNGAELVTGDVPDVAVSVQIETFDFLALKLDLSLAISLKKFETSYCKQNLRKIR